jgi:hypothetical protein
MARLSCSTLMILFLCLNYNLASKYSHFYGCALQCEHVFRSSKVNTSLIFSFLFSQGKIVELERNERCSYTALILGSSMLPLGNVELSMKTMEPI